MRQAFPKDSQIAARYAAAQRPVYPGCDCWVEVPFEGAHKKIASPHDTAGCYAESPVPVGTPSPVYPEFAKEAQIQGTVVLHALVSAEGSVANIKVFRGITGLNDVAVDAVKRWRFQPAMKAGQPTCTWIEVPVEFRLP
jgi:protein TonB